MAEITRIRKALFDIVSVGEKLDASDGIFRRDVPVFRLVQADVRWTVFRDLNSSRRTIVLANLGSVPLAADGLSLEDNASGACRIHQPFEATREARFPVALQVPAERLAFITES